MSDVLRSMATGAAISVVFAVNGAFMHHLSTLDGLGAKITHFAAHGISGGAMSAVNGGSFKDGFVGGLAGNALSVLTPNLGGPSLAGVALRTSLAAVAGGAASSLRGGSFVDGAYSAAFNHLYNAEGGKLALKGAQRALRLAGNIPGIGIAADLASAGIAFYTGDYVGGVIDLVSVVPGVGDVAGNALRVAYEGYGAAKWAGKTLRKASAEGTTRLWRAVEPDELLDVLKYGDYNIHWNSTFKRFAFEEASLDDFIAANSGRVYAKTFIDVPTEKLDLMFRHPDPGGVGRAIGIDVYETPEFYDWFDTVNVLGN